MFYFFHVRRNFRPTSSSPPLPACLCSWSGFRKVLRGRIVLIFFTSRLANNVEGTVVHISAGRHLKGRQSGAEAICIKLPGPCQWSGWSPTHQQSHQRTVDSIRCWSRRRVQQNLISALVAEEARAGEEIWTRDVIRHKYLTYIHKTFTRITERYALVHCFQREYLNCSLKKIKRNGCFGIKRGKFLYVIKNVEFHEMLGEINSLWLTVCVWSKHFFSTLEFCSVCALYKVGHVCAFLRSVKVLTAVRKNAQSWNGINDESFSSSLSGWQAQRVFSTVWFSSSGCFPLPWIPKEIEVHKAPSLILTKTTQTNRSSNRSLRRRAPGPDRGRANPHQPTRSWSPARKLCTWQSASIWNGTGARPSRSSRPSTRKGASAAPSSTASVTDSATPSTSPGTAVGRRGLSSRALSVSRSVSPPWLLLWTARTSSLPPRRNASSASNSAAVFS